MEVAADVDRAAAIEAARVDQRGAQQVDQAAAEIDAAAKITMRIERAADAQGLAMERDMLRPQIGVAGEIAEPGVDAERLRGSAKT